MNRRGRVSPGTAAVSLPGSYGQYKTLLQNATEWHCIPNTSAGKKESWICLPKGWKHFQDRCYYMSDDTMSWAESEQNCTAMGSHLVVINSTAEQEFLFNLAKGVFTNAYETKYYIGLTSSKSGQWQWVDQSPYNKAATFWKPGEPNLLFAEKCAAIHIKGKTPTLTVTGIMSSASQVATDFVNWQSNLSEEGNSTLDQGPKILEKGWLMNELLKSWSESTQKLYLAT